MLNASAVKVVDMMLRPAMPGTMMFSSFWLDAKIAPNSARKISGSRKLKNAAVGLRQNIRRSSRYWRQARRRHQPRRRVSAAPRRSAVSSR